MGTLGALFPLESTADPREWLERFVARALTNAGVWSSRVSDGIAAYRIVERDAVRFRACGRLWDIDQTLHSFWLDVERDLVATDRVNWTLYFDVDQTSMSPRRARSALDVIEAPGDVSWVLTLTGSG